MGWSTLPEDILTEVYLYLRLPDRYQASLVCRTWAGVFHSPYVWTHCELLFRTAHHAQMVELVRRYGQNMKSVSILVDPSEQVNRENACAALLALAHQPNRRLQTFKIRFIEQNPCLYNGQEFLDCLYALFGPAFSSQPNDVISGTKAVDTEDVEGLVCEGVSTAENVEASHRGELEDVESENVYEGKRGVSQLKHVDLSGLNVNLDGRILDLLSANHPDLESLDIQNKVLVCLVHPGHMQQFVERCRKLKSLRFYSFSNSEELLLSLIQKQRASLEHLSIIHRRVDKLVKNISREVWAAVVKKLPNLRVTLGFDESCPLFKLSEVMHPEIPVTVLRLETSTDLAAEIRLAASYYGDTLEKLIVNSPPTRAHELDNALVELSRRCRKLTSLHVFCVLEKQTVDEILDTFPLMKARGAYTLKYIAEEHPWKPGNDFWP